MPVPKQRHTKSRRNRRRSHHALKAIRFVSCPKCSASVRPHHTCINCGTYRGHTVIDVLAKLSKREKKQKEKELARQEKEERGKEGGSLKSMPLSAEELSKR